MISLTEMTKKDVDEVYELDQICFDLPWTKKMFIDDLDSPLAYYYVIKDDDKIVGYCGFWDVLGEGHITNIAVHPDYRKQGLGSMLVERLIEEAKLHVLSILTLEVRESNFKAHRLYGKYGFKMIGRRPKYYINNNEDAYIMTKEIEF